MKINDNQFNELMSVVKRVCSFDSACAPAIEGAPFGKNINDCLLDFLALGKEYGFETENVDGYAGEIIFKGTSENLSLGILGHLDIIPADPKEWKHHPFKGEIEDGFLFARGTMDDKGPLVACLYAIKLLKDSGFVPTKTIKIIAGCDEETGMRGVKYYLTKKEAPTFSFTPDADFPVIHAEKGIMHFEVNCGKLPCCIKDIYGGVRANVVMDQATAILDDGTKLETFGLAAHAAIAHKGKNASWELLQKLHEICPDHKGIEFLANSVCDISGAKWGIDAKDNLSQLTCNLGVLRVVDGNLIATIDIRFPVSYTLEQMKDIVRAHTPFDVTFGHCDNPLLVDKDSFLVQTLLSTYNQLTNSNLDALVIGGGTYSKQMPNCVAFGPSFPDEEETIHMPDERVNLNNLRKFTEIYMEAIKRLAE